MLKLILQLTVGLAGFFVAAHVVGWLMPVFTNPIVFTVVVGFVVVVAIGIAVRTYVD
jgi:putative effector of murein hydrolase